MSKSFVQPGDSITITNVTTVADTLIGFGSMVAMPSKAVSSGTAVECATEGVFSVDAQAGTYTRGDRVLFDVSAGNVDDKTATPATGDFWCGIAWETKTLGSTGKLKVKINAPAPVPT